MCAVFVAVFIYGGNVFRVEGRVSIAVMSSLGTCAFGEYKVHHVCEGFPQLLNSRMLYN